MDKYNFCFTDYIVLDIETTGFSYCDDDIIEVSAIRVRNNIILDEFSELICIDDELPDFIIELTGITDEMLKGKDKVDNVLSRLIGFIGEDIIIGHNISFDLNFIKEKNKKPLLNKYIDTLGLSRRIIKDINNHKLDTLAAYYGIKRDLHRSLKDCVVTYQVYNNLIDYIQRNNIDFHEIQRIKDSEYLNSLNNIVPNIIFDINVINGFYYDKNVVATGKLDNYSKHELGQMIVNKGGYFSDSVNRITNVLILGNQDYQASLYGSKSSKHLKAIELISLGYDILIIDERTAINLLNK